MLKTQCAKTIHFRINFYWNFLRFGFRKWKENLLFFGSLSKKLILWKSLFFHGKIAIFLVLNLQKRIKFRCNFFSIITSEKIALKSNLGIDFGFPKPPKLLQKAMLNEACFATLWKSPQSRRKSTGVIAFGLPIWLRIWLGLLYLSIYWSAPRRPNHQSKVCNLTCSSHISAHWTRESKNIVQRH